MATNADTFDRRTLALARAPDAPAAPVSRLSARNRPEARVHDDAMAPAHDPHLQDVLLVRRIRDGDSATFDALFQSFYSGLCGFVSHQVGSPQVAEELVQEVFADLWRRRREWDPHGPVKRYLYRAAKNQALNHLRHRRVEDRSREQVLKSLRRHQQTPEDVLRFVELSTLVHGAIEQLPERCRQVFLLSRKSGLSYAEIAELLEISVKTVETQMGRALKAIRSVLDSHLP